MPLTQKIHKNKLPQGLIITSPNGCLGLTLVTLFTLVKDRKIQNKTGTEATTVAHSCHTAHVSSPKEICVFLLSFHEIFFLSTPVFVSCQTTNH